MRPEDRTASDEPVQAERAVGCSALECSRCRRRVRHRDGVMLGRRPDVFELEAAYEQDAMEPYLMTSSYSGKYRVYYCACEVRAVGEATLADELAEDMDIRWRCAGHP